MQRYAIIVLVLIIAGGAFGGWERHQGIKQGEAIGNARVATLQAKYAQATAKAESDARAKEQAAAVAMTQIQQTYYQQGVTDANAKSDAVIAGLRAGTLRLRERWRGCQGAPSVSAPGSRSGKPDAATDERSQGASDLVRIAAEADAQIRALQAVIKADRQ